MSLSITEVPALEAGIGGDQGDIPFLHEKKAAQ